jgi:Fe2+ or Zn2+ uptake regulation protein
MGLPVDVVQGHYRELDSYEVQGYRIEFYGVCPRCKENHEGRETGNIE